MYMRPIIPSDRDALADLLQRIDNFNQEEVTVALELIDESLENPSLSGYRCIVALKTMGEREQPVGYICFGKTPMTEHTYDLYWIVVDPRQRKTGIGHSLFKAMSEMIRNSGGANIRVETSSQSSYTAANTFYLKNGFQSVGRLKNFYCPDDDLLIFYKIIPGLEKKP